MGTHDPARTVPVWISEPAASPEPELREIRDPNTGYGVISVFVGRTQVAGAVASANWRDDGLTTLWQITSTLPSFNQLGLKSVDVRDEQQARAWLLFLAGLYLHRV